MLEGALAFLREAEGGAAAGARAAGDALWCSGALAAASAEADPPGRVAALYALLRPSTFDGVPLLRVALPVADCDAACVVRAVEHAGDGPARVLHAGSPAAQDGGVARLALAAAAGREGALALGSGGALLELRADPPAALRVAWAPPATRDDGGLVATIGACELDDGTLRPCLPAAGFEIAYDPDCGERHAAALRDRVVLWRVWPGDARAMRERVAHELRALYNVTEAEDVLVRESAWQPLLGLAGALHITYEVRTAETRALASRDQLHALARTLRLGAAVRPSAAWLGDAAPLLLLAAALCAAAAVARRALLRIGRVRGSKRAVTVTTAGAGVYEKSLTL